MHLEFTRKGARITCNETAISSRQEGSALSNSDDESWQYYRDVTIGKLGYVLEDYPVLVNLIGLPLNMLSDNACRTGDGA